MSISANIFKLVYGYEGKVSFFFSSLDLKKFGVESFQVNLYELKISSMD